MSRYPQQTDENGRIETSVFNGVSLHFKESEEIIILSDSSNPADKWRRLTTREWLGKSIPEPDATIRYQKNTRLPDGKLWCSSCQLYHEPTAFNKDKHNVIRGRRWYCKEAEAEQRLKRYHSHKFDKVLKKTG